MATATYYGPSLYGTRLRQVIELDAAARGLDPEAVDSVVDVEGGWQGAAGDNRTSWGPFQLHEGGRLPSSVAAQPPASRLNFAQSRTGVDYALDAIAGVAGGKKGEEAVHAIVYQFEAPRDPAAEVRKAMGHYGTHGTAPAGSSTTSNAAFPGIPGLPSIPGLPGIIPGLPYKPGTVLGGVEGAANAFSRLVGFLFSYRFLELLGGFGLVAIGAVLLGRKLGAPNPIQIVANAAPADSWGGVKSR